GAGTGKSRNATEFRQTAIACLSTTITELEKKIEGTKAESRLEEDEKELKMARDLRKKLESAWVFNITFENGTTWIKQEEPNPYRAVGSRMLYQLLSQSMND